MHTLINQCNTTVSLHVQFLLQHRAKVDYVEIQRIITTYLDLEDGTWSNRKVLVAVTLYCAQNMFPSHVLAHFGHFAIARLIAYETKYSVDAGERQ
jgi:hypothetical protein